jgi:hypothetical protein
MGMAKRAWEEAQHLGLGSIDGALCESHVRDSFLLREIITARVEGQCHICGEPGSSLIDAEDLLRPMLELISETWGPVQSPYAHTSDKFELFYDYFGDLFDNEDPIDIFEWLATGVDRYDWGLEDDWPGDDLEELDSRTSTAKWNTFVKLVQYESRFIFLTAESTNSPEGGSSAAEFAADFGRILSDYESSLVRTLDEGSELFRGRMISELNQAVNLASANELGPAPKNVAAASRMSPAGISMFYGSETLETAVAEISSHDAAQRDFALVGKFKTLRKLRVLDLANIETPSIFDGSRGAERTDKLFLRAFARDITRPIRLDGREHREYAPTQVLTELVRWSTTPEIDGIRVQSAQDQQPTYVMFFGPGSAVDAATPNEDATFILDSRDIEVVQVRRHVTFDRVPPHRWQPEVSSDCFDPED